MSADKVWSITITATTRNGSVSSREVWAKDLDVSDVVQQSSSAMAGLLNNLMDEGLLRDGS